MKYNIQMEHVVALFDILAWPITLIVIVFVGIGRKQIKSLIAMIESIKYKDVKIEFSRTLDQVKENIGETSQHEPHLIADESEIYTNILKTSPEAAVIKSWQSLELSAINKVKDLLPDNESFRNPLQRPTDYLEHKGALTPTTASAIRDLRSLRNQIVHRNVDEISPEDAMQYEKLATAIRRKIDAITELPAIKLTALTLLVLDINHLLDSRKFDDISIEEVYDWIKKEEILPSLNKRTGGAIALSDYSDDGPYSNFSTFYHDQMKALADAYAGDHEKKWRVENSGLCLLLAWTNQIIQSGSGWHPDVW